MLLMRQQLLEPAASCWERALEWLSEPSSSEEERPESGHLEARLRRKAGWARRMLGEARRAEVHLQIALDLAVDLGSSETEAEAQMELGRLYRSQSRTTLAVIHLEAAHQAAVNSVGDEPLIDAPHWARRVAVSALEDQGILAREAGRGDDSAALFQQALEIAGEDDVLAAQALLGLSSSRSREEDYDGALELLSTALEKARLGGDRVLMARILNNTGITHHMAGRMEAALHHYRAARDLYRAVGYPYGLVVSLHNVGDSHMRLGAHGRAWASFEESRKLGEQLGIPMGKILNEPYMAYLEALRAIEAGEPAESAPFVARIESIVEEARDIGDLETSVVARALVGRTLRAFGQSEEARFALEQAIEGAREIESAPLVHEFERELADLG
jgi:tetratricopeptide (TPR) repeat protein